MEEINELEIRKVSPLRFANSIGLTLSISYFLYVTLSIGFFIIRIGTKAIKLNYSRWVGDYGWALFLA